MGLPSSSTSIPVTHGRTGYAESFNSRFRIECLNRELPYTLSESRVVFADWRDYYNNIRPHRSLGLQGPSQFARNHSTQGLGSGRPTDSLRPGLPENQHQPTEIITQLLGQKVGSNHLVACVRTSPPERVRLNVCVVRFSSASFEFPVESASRSVASRKIVAHNAADLQPCFASAFIAPCWESTLFAKTSLNALSGAVYIP